MKVAFLLLHDFRFAGWSLRDYLSRYHFSKEYARLLSERGIEVSLITMHDEAASVMKIPLNGYECIVLPDTVHFPPILGFGNSHYPLAHKIIESVNPDIIHFNNYYLWSFPYLSIWAKAKGFRLVCQYHGACDFLLPLRRLFRSSYRSADKYLVPLKSEAAYLANKMKVETSKIALFPNVGVDVSLFRPVSEKADEPTIIYAGRMPLPSKNLGEQSPWLLLEIMRHLGRLMPSVRLIMAGDGPGLAHLKEFAERNRLENVSFTGYVRNSELPPLYSSSWLTFTPFRAESIDAVWGGASKESLSCSTPVVAFSGSRDMIAERLNGYGYLLPQDPMSAAKSLARILGDKGSLVRLGKIGREAVMETSSWPRVITELIRVYDSLFV
uniref:Glycosyltransferase family 1 protein n=1 Tax=Candidatus Methanomethylicus mesodigestus TaxID=1867258 RepID=A0A7C3J2L2_9CREN